MSRAASTAWGLGSPDFFTKSARTISLAEGKHFRNVLATKGKLPEDSAAIAGCPVASLADRTVATPSPISTVIPLPSPSGSGSAPQYPPFF
jgi:hypothetical protein